MEVRLARKKKFVNKTNIPEHKIEKIARCLFLDILAFYNSEEGQKEFEEWKKQRNVDKNGNGQKYHKVQQPRTDALSGVCCISGSFSGKESLFTLRGLPFSQSAAAPLAVRRVHACGRAHQILV